MNEIVINICRFLCGHAFSTPLGKYQGVSFSDYVIRVCLFSRLSSKALYNFVFPLAMNESSCCSTSWLAFDEVSVLDLGHFIMYIVISHYCVFLFLFCGTGVQTQAFVLAKSRQSTT
jgi:hypothetical protein